MDIELRGGNEIQAAHDRLTAIVLGEVPNPFPAHSNEVALRVALDVLCWVLQHEHNQTFAENLAKIDKVLDRLGFRLRDSGRLQVPGKD